MMTCERCPAEIVVHGKIDVDLMNAHGWYVTSVLISNEDDGLRKILCTWICPACVAKLPKKIGDARPN